MVPELLETYTPMIQQLICQPEFNIVHLGVLLLENCVTPIPGMKWGIAVNRCSTSCIKDLSVLMKQGMRWELVEALIKHGTVPDAAAIEVSMYQYNKPKAALFIAKKVKDSVQYDHLLSLAISKEWYGSFIKYCISKGGKFSYNDLWSVLRWKNDSKVESMLEKILKNGGSADVKDDKGQLPLTVLLKKNMFTKVLILLEYGADTSTVDISDLIKKLIKLKTGTNNCSTKVLNSILKNKSKLMNIKDELNQSLTIAFKNKQYELAALLIEYGADITHITDHDKSTTPVHVATIIALYVKGKIAKHHCIMVLHNKSFVYEEN